MKYVLLSFLLILSSCSYINQKLGLEDDHFIEESGEAVLKDRVGLDLDFTPDSPEE